MINIFRVEKRNDPEVQRTTELKIKMITSPIALHFILNVNFQPFLALQNQAWLFYFFVLRFCYSAVTRNHSILNL